MISYLLRWKRAFIALACLAPCCMAQTAVAKEPVESFLDGLRRLEMHDVAVIYLESLNKRANLSPELKAILPYEEGISLVAGSRSVFDPALRNKQLDTAVAKFTQFIKDNPKHPRAAMANTQMGNVLVERAKVEIERSQKPINAAKKGEMVEASRKYFAEAQKTFENADKQFEASLEKFPKVIDKKTEYALYEERDQVRMDYMQAKLFAASVVYEYAHAFDPKDPKHKELLLESAKRYEKINERWRSYVAGLFALMWAGRSYQEIGDRKKALGLYNELLNLDASGDELVNSLIAQTLRLAISCWIHESEKQYDEAIKQGDAWVEKTRNDKTVDGLGVHWMLCEANYLKAQGMKVGDKKEDQVAKKKILATALKHAKIVAGFENEFRKPAQSRVAELSGVEGPADGPPTNFAEARERAQAALENAQVFDNQYKEAKTDKEKTDLAAKRNADQKKAMGYFEMAMNLRHKSEEPIPVDMVNRIRHILCFLNFQRQNYYDAALLGEYLAQRYPSYTGSKQAAKIALASYVFSYNIESPNRQTDMDSIERVANLIVNRWKGEPEADEALMKLSDIHLSADKTDEAIKALAGISEKSPLRSLADTKAGHVLWSQYIRMSKGIEGELPPEVAQKRKEAETLLLKGVPAMRKLVTAENPPTGTLLTSEVSLSQLFIETNRAPDAVKILETKPMGLLELVDKNDPVTKSGILRGETYKAALRAYVSVNRSDDAEKMMKALDQEYSSKEDADRLTRIYVTLGKELERQLSELPEDQKVERAALLDSFEKFLTRITKRPGNNFGTLNWIAETFYALGAGTESRGQPTKESKSYFAKSSDAFNRIIAEMEKDDKFGPQNTATSPNLRDQHKIRLQVKLAVCTRRAGDFDNAIKQLGKILDANPMMLEAQLEAAYSLQAWGASDTAKYKAAMIGDLKKTDAKTKRVSNLIWGWSHMSILMQKSAAKNKALMGYFHEARYNLNYCRYLRAVAEKVPDAKKDLLDSAEKDILTIARLYPDMGGDEWGSRYRKLYSNVMQLNNRTPTSLDAAMAAARKATLEATGSAKAPPAPPKSEGG